MILTGSQFNVFNKPFKQGIGKFYFLKNKFLLNNSFRNDLLINYQKHHKNSRSAAILGEHGSKENAP